MSVSQNIEIAGRQIKDIILIKKYLIISIIIGVAIALFYFIATQLLTITLGRNSDFSFIVASDWASKVFKIRAFPNFEPIIAFAYGPIFFLIPLPNIILGIVIASLASLNMTVSIYSITAPKTCRINPAQGILSSLPAFATGFACCSPMLLIGLGIFSAGITLTFIQFLPYFVPISLFGLILSLFWSSWRLATKIEGSTEQTSEKPQKVVSL